MSWLNETRTVTSEKNGTIRIRRTFGQTEIMVGGAEESSPYITRMWKNALTRIPCDARARKILVLGVCAGGCIAPLLRRFPNSHITGIEWDPVMMQILKESHLVPSMERFEVMVGDVRDILPKLSDTFDLILFDLFTGPKIHEDMMSDAFIGQLERLLDRKGHIIVNAYKQPATLDSFKKRFASSSTWKFQFNRLGLFRHFGAGTIGDPLLDGYVPFRSSEAYLAREYAGSSCHLARNSSGAFGIAWNVGPIRFEKYWSDSEPIRTTDEPQRLTIWQRITRNDVPRGWWRTNMPITSRMTGYVQISPDRSFTKDWSDAAQRQLSRWQRSSRNVTEVALEEFLEGNERSTLPRDWKKSVHAMLRSKSQKHGDRVRLFAVKANDSDRLAAGLAVLDVPEISSSVHLAAFFLDEFRNEPFSVGLIHHWFETSLKKEIRFLDFDQFWSAGEPRSWQGFSRFKDQFGIRYIRYPKTLLKL